VAKKDQKEQSGADAKKEKKAKGADVEMVEIPADYVPRLFKRYNDHAVPALKKRFGYKNPLEVPRLEKVILNVGMGDAHADQKLLDSVLEELTIISGQKPVVTRARKSISNFKLREGMQVGARVTLRRAHMWEFVDKLFSIATPRIRDFRGLPDRSFDGRGNYSLGIKEQIVFPEIDYDRVVKIHGMDITFVTSARNDEEAKALLEELGCPFRKRQTAETAA
jgi:large subunit ribosomal protein L5